MDAQPAPELPDWIQRQLPPGIVRSRIDVGRLRMHLMEIGQGRPVLAVHGNPSWSFLYRKVAAALPSWWCRTGAAPSPCARWPIARR